ncbi:MAG: PAS domain-containing protein [Alphaproteobacteria bacterium]|nr:PAS domain-containing protein [Alphaproteobacteria bacterium]
MSGITLVLVAAAAVFSVFQFIESEREREIRAWQVRLGIVADSRFAAVTEWVNQQFKVLSGLAANQSLQIYMTLAAEESGEYADVTEDPAEVGYLRNLLEVTAERTGFTGKSVGADVAANVQKIGAAGMALLDSRFRVVVATQEMPPIEGKILAFLKDAPRGERAVLDIFLGPEGKPAMGFSAPVFAIQGDVGASAQIGTVVGIREVSGDLYSQLIQPGAVEKTAETILVRPSKGAVEYLSPLQDDTSPMEKKLALSTPDLAAAFAIETPGGFGIKKDYLDKEVLVTGREFTIAPWTLVHKIDRAEALANSEERLNRLLIMFLMFIGVIIAAILAVWWKGSSVRATESAEKFEKLAERFQNQRNFMHLVTDSQPNSITIFDEKGRYRWFNKVLLDSTGLERGDLFDKSASSVIGPSEGKKVEKWISDCLEKNEPMSFTHGMEIPDKGEIILQSDFIPLEERDGMPPGVLMVSQDISAAVKEKEQRERNMRQLVRTLVAIVDGRDPYSAQHSIRVGMVARAIMAEVGAEDELVDTAEFAGNLMNLGKISVPEAILTKTGRLTKKEIVLIRDSVTASAGLISEIEFNGPVVETLRQLQEHVDGSGTPGGLKGDDILITARVVAVANAFIAMVTPRAFRPASTFDEAVDRLLKQSGKVFDRGVVASLISYLDHRGGRLEWADFSKPLPKGGGSASGGNGGGSMSPPEPEPPEAATDTAPDSSPEAPPETPEAADAEEDAPAPEPSAESAPPQAPFF